jgi:hypothetical protein
MDRSYLDLLAIEGNGAVEVAHPAVTQPIVITMIGPIKTWWGRITSPEYYAYARWRDAVRVAIVKEGHVIYSPHRAWQGSWHEHAQKINDLAVELCDIVVVLTPPGVEAKGTEAEIRVGQKHGKTIIYAPPAGEQQLYEMLSEIQKYAKNR